MEAKKIKMKGRYKLMKKISEEVGRKLTWNETVDELQRRCDPCSL
jgi:hypothetical protein